MSMTEYTRLFQNGGVEKPVRFLKQALVLLFMALFLLGAGFPGFAQNALSFDDALKNVLAYLTERISAGSTVAVLSFQSDHPNLSEYVIDDITSGLVNTDLYTVVDRRSLELLAQEMAFQLSGEVSDETALAIGRRLGAQMVISGGITYLGEFYRLRVQAIEVETARIQGSQNVTVQPNRMLATLTGRLWTGPVEPAYTPPVMAEPEETAPAPAEPTRPPMPASNTHRFYLGLRGGFSFHIYEADDYGIGKNDFGFGGDASAQMSLQIFDFFAVQAEAGLIAGDTFETEVFGHYANYPIIFKYSAMTLPLLGKITLRPGIFLLAGFGGVYFTLPFSPMTLDVNGTEYLYNFTAPMGFIAGGNIGIKLGPGTLFLDIRYAADFDATGIWGDWGSQAIYKRSLMTSSVGYEFGFGGGKGK
jgi:TolB-like protein